MVRDLVYVLRERNEGIAHGFANFLKGDVGQLIFKRAYLMPTQKDFRVRQARLNE
jgi:phosphate transport system substrate-binding protein